MKKIAFVTTLFTVLVIVMMFATGLVGASGLHGGHGDDHPPPKTEGGAWLNTVYKEPSGAAVRIDFEVSMHKARRGLYVINLVDGGQLASWYARGGEMDIVLVEFIDWKIEPDPMVVVYYAGPGAKPITMKMLTYPLSAILFIIYLYTAEILEVAWPDQPLMPMARMSSPHK